MFDQIYDPCQTCKKRLNAFLRYQDQQIGNMLNKAKFVERKVMPSRKEASTNLRRTRHENQNIDAMHAKNETGNIVDENVYNNQFGIMQKNLKKGHPMISNLESNEQILNKKRNQIDNNTKQLLEYNNKKNANLNNDSLSENHSHSFFEENKTSYSFVLKTVFNDILLLLAINLVFASDIANLIYDSSIWNTNSEIEAARLNSSIHLFGILVYLYKYLNFLLALALLISLRLVFLR
jgi:hypothetical protein